MHSLGPSYYDQVGNEHPFFAVLCPEVGNTIHFLPQNMTEP
jgi:hypothetical protein